MSPEAAVMVVAPVPTPVASPVLETVAAEVSVEDQVRSVRLAVVPSE